MITLAAGNPTSPAANVIEFFLFRSFHGKQGLITAKENSFISFPTLNMTEKNKRLIVSKGDGKNYLGYAPDGTIHNMRKSFGGGFYKVVWKPTENEHLTTVGDALKKSEFTLVE